MITTYSYDEANQLSYDYTPTLRTTYSYDANGNTTLTNAGGSVTTYCWDVENRMTLAELPTGTRTTATYDGDGKRRSYADSAGLRGFLWDGENIARETDAAGAAVADPWIGGQPACRVGGESNGAEGGRACTLRSSVTIS